MDPFELALQGALTTVNQLAGRSVLYASGSKSATVRAVVGQTVVENATVEGFVVTQRQRDYLILVADLVLAGQPHEPQQFDRITDGTEVYEVQPVANREFERSGTANFEYRIHTVQVQ